MDLDLRDAAQSQCRVRLPLIGA